MDPDSPKLGIRRTKRMKQGILRAVKQGRNMTKLEAVIDDLASRRQLPASLRDHALRGGEFQGCRECHIEPDWLLVYKVIESELILKCVDTGTHSDIFG